MAGGVPLTVNSRAPERPPPKLREALCLIVILTVDDTSRGQMSGAARAARAAAPSVATGDSLRPLSKVRVDSEGVTRAAAPRGLRLNVAVVA